MNQAIAYFVALSLFVGCSHKNSDISKVLKRVEAIGYDDLLDSSVYLNGGSSTEGIIYVNTIGAECGPYIVRFNYQKQEITEVQDNLVIGKCPNGFYSQGRIDSLVRKFMQLNVRLIRVDGDTNVFINPTALSQPTLIKSRDPQLTKGKRPLKVLPDWYEVIQ